MDHSHHAMDHGGMDHDDMMCNMNMVFTWDAQNLCVIFRQWRITGPISLILSLAAVVLLTAGYELVREMSRRYEARRAEEVANTPNDVDDVAAAEETRSLLWPGRNAKAAEKSGKIGSAAFYAVQVFYSFFIMLLFMTYNGWIMLAVAVGAFLGYLVWGGSTSTKSVACH